MHFRVAVGEYLPFLRLKMNITQIHMSGPLADAFHMVAERANFTYTLHRAEGDIWGIHGPNGWTGLLGMLSRNEVDFALGPFTLTHSRWSSFQVSVPMYVDTVEILVPSMDWKMSLFNLVTVFTYNVWILLVCAMFSICILLSVIEKYEKPHISFPRSLLRSFWDVMRTLLQKGRLRRPFGFLSVMLAVLWMLTAMVMSHLFCGVIQSILLLKRVQKIDSIDDLNTSQDVMPILEDQSSVYATFRDGQSDIFRSIFAKAVNNPDQCILTFKNMSSLGMDLVLTKSFSIITDGMGLRHFLSKRHKDGLPCSYRLAKETLWPLWKVIAFGDEFPQLWIKKINGILRHTFESRWLHQRMIFEFSEYTECLYDGKIGVQSLMLEHTLGTFIIWAIGIVFSILVFLAEIYFYKKSVAKKFVDDSDYSRRMRYHSKIHPRDKFYETIQRILNLQFSSKRQISIVDC